MRKPRDIDAELRALAEKAKGLKARKVTQLGELVMATGAEGLEPEILAGLLLAAVDAEAEAKEAWRQRGAAFFREQGKPGKAAAGRAAAGRGGGQADAGGASASRSLES